MNKYIKFFNKYIFWHRHAQLKSTKLHTTKSVLPNDWQQQQQQPAQLNIQHQMRYIESSASPIGCNVGESSNFGRGGDVRNSSTSGGESGCNPGAISLCYEIQEQQRLQQQQEPKFTSELPDVDETDPDVIPNQYGNFYVFLKIFNIN